MEKGAKSFDLTPCCYLERETGFEPATSTLARSHSTTELLPLYRLDYSGAARRGSIKASQIERWQIADLVISNLRIARSQTEHSGSFRKHASGAKARLGPHSQRTAKAALHP